MKENIESYPRLYELAGSRYSCRNYTGQPVGDDLVKAVLDMARLAPSAKNLQPWHFVVVRNPDTRARILAKSRPSFIDAPVVIAACGSHLDSWHRPSDNKDHTDIDVAIAVEHICLAAASLGLGSCWICSFDVEATREALDVPDGWEPVALIPIGYPDPEYAQAGKIRKPLPEIVSWEKF